MPLPPFEATKKLCEASGWSISNLELQKHLFLAQLEFMRGHEGRLIDAIFEAWDYGPVVPEIYRSVKRFGAAPVQNIFHALPSRLSSLDHYLYSSYEKYKDKNPGQLVALTHRVRGAWDKNYRAGMMGIIIPDRDIRQEARFGITT